MKILGGKLSPCKPAFRHHEWFELAINIINSINLLLFESSFFRRCWARDKFGANQTRIELSSSLWRCDFLNGNTNKSSLNLLDVHRVVFWIRWLDALFYIASFSSLYPLLVYRLFTHLIIKQSTLNVILLVLAVIFVISK